MKTNSLKIEIGFGIGTKRNGHFLKTTERERALVRIRRYAGELFGGCTVIPTNGFWISQSSNREFIEPGRSLCIVTEAKRGTTAKVHSLSEFIKDQLSQECVLITASKCHSQLF